MNCISRLLLRQDWFDRFPLSRERQWGGLEITEKVVVITEVIDFSGNSPFREREIQRDLSSIIFT
jgi:hypothetical protein